MLSRVVGQAFKSGTQAGDLIIEINSCIRKVRDMSKHGRMFKQLQDHAGSKQMLKSFLAHRFLGVYCMLERFLECWTSIELFHQLADLPFEVSDREEEVRQICALLQPLAAISTDMQSQKVSNGW